MSGYECSNILMILPVAVKVRFRGLAVTPSEKLDLIYGGLTIIQRLWRSKTTDLVTQL